MKSTLPARTTVGWRGLALARSAPPRSGGRPPTLSVRYWVWAGVRRLPDSGLPADDEHAALARPRLVERSVEPPRLRFPAEKHGSFYASVPLRPDVRPVSRRVIGRVRRGVGVERLRCATSPRSSGKSTRLLSGVRRFANPAGARAERVVVELLTSRSCGARHHVSLL